MVWKKLDLNEKLRWYWVPRHFWMWTLYKMINAYWILVTESRYSKMLGKYLPSKFSPLLRLLHRKSCGRISQIWTLKCYKIDLCCINFCRGNFSRYCLSPQKLVKQKFFSQNYQQMSCNMRFLVKHGTLKKYFGRS